MKYFVSSFLSAWTGINFYIGYIKYNGALKDKLHCSMRTEFKNIGMLCRKRENIVNSVTFFFFFHLTSKLILCFLPRYLPWCI